MQTWALRDATRAAGEFSLLSLPSARRSWLWRSLRLRGGPRERLYRASRAMGSSRARTPTRAAARGRWQSIRTVASSCPARHSIERYRPNGTSDPSFSGDGRIQTNFIVQSVAVDSQDRIVAAGYANNPADRRHNQVFAVGRFRVNGTPDPSFSGDGLALTPIGGGGGDQASAVAVDGQGRIVAAGHSYKHPAGTFFALARYMPNGNPDTSFSGDGQLQTEFPNVQNAFGQDVALDSGGRIVVAGRTDDRFAVARYGPHGGLRPLALGRRDVTTAMAANASAGETVAVDDSDRILVGGLASFTDPSKYEFALARYRPNGALDPSFSGDGKAYTSFGRDRSDDTGLSIDDQGRIVAAGWTFDENNSHSAFALARYTPGGALDPTFWVTAASQPRWGRSRSETESRSMRTARSWSPGTRPPPISPIRASPLRAIWAGS